MPEAATTKKVRITLAALTRVEYTEVLEVPADMSDEDLEALVDKRYDDVDGGNFVDDPDYWVRGECSFSIADEMDPEPNGVVAIDEDGNIVVSMGDDKAHAVAIPRYLVAEGWSHLLESGESTVRFALDRFSKAIIYAEILVGQKWCTASEALRKDLEDSVINANSERLESPVDYGLDKVDEDGLPSWCNQRPASEYGLRNPA